MYTMIEFVYYKFGNVCYILENSSEQQILLIIRILKVDRYQIKYEK